MDFLIGTGLARCEGGRRAGGVGRWGLCGGRGAIGRTGAAGGGGA